MNHEDIENFQMTTYVKYPSKKLATKSIVDPVVTYQKQIVRSSSFGQLPFEPLLDGEEPFECIKARYKAFQKYWNNCESRINKVIEKYTSPLLNNILEKIISPFPSNTFKSNSTSNFRKIPTILLLSGTNMDYHSEIFDGLDNMINSNCTYSNIRLIQLDSKICVDVKSTLRIILLSLYKFQENGMKVPELDFDLIDEYCHNNLAAERSTLASTKLRIVLLIKNISTFNQQVLYKVISILQKSSDIVPLKLIFNIPSFSTEFYDSILLSSTKKNIQNTVIKVENNSNILIDNIMEIVLSSSLFDNEGYKSNVLPILIGPDLCRSLLQRFNHSLPTIGSFVNGLKYSIMTHFYSNPLMCFFNEFAQTDEQNIFIFENDDPEGHPEITLQHQIYIRHLPSVQNFIEKLVNDSSGKIPTRELITLALYFSSEDISELTFSRYLSRRFIPFATSVYRRSLYNLWCFLELINFLQDSIIFNNALIRKNEISSSISNEKFLNFSKLCKVDLYCMVLEEARHGESKQSQFIRNVLQGLKTVLPFCFVKLFNEIMDFIAKLHLNSHKMSRSFKKLENQLIGIQEKVNQFAEGGEFYYDLENINTHNDNKNNDGLKNIPLRGKIIFEKLQDDFVDIISVIFFQRKSLKQSSIFSSKSDDFDMGLTSSDTSQPNDVDYAFDYIRLSQELSVDFSSFKNIPFNEVFIVGNQAASSALYPDSRKYIENALSDPKCYERVSFCNNFQFLEENKKRKGVYTLSSTSLKKAKSSYSSNNLDSDVKLGSTIIELQKLNKPLMVEMFRLYREAPLYINIADYFHAFKLKLDKEKYSKLFSKILQEVRSNSYFSNQDIRDELIEFFENSYDETSWEKICMTFFIQSLADLQYVGILKESTGRKKSEYLEKNFWKSI